MSRLPVVPISFSTSSSTGRPWQSQPPLRRHQVAGHRLEARVDVLERARLDVVDARACRSRWAGPRRRPTRARPLAQLERAREDVGLASTTRGSAPRARGSDTFGSTGSNAPIVPTSRRTNASSSCEDEAPGPRGTTPLAAPSRRAAAHRPPTTASRDHGRVPPASTAVADVRRRFGQGLGEDVRRGRRRRLPPSRLARAPRSRRRVPVVAVPRMLHPCRRPTAPSATASGAADGPLTLDRGRERLVCYPSPTMAAAEAHEEGARRPAGAAARRSSAELRSSSRRSRTTRSPRRSRTCPATSASTTSRPTPARRRSSARRTSRSRTTSATCSQKIDRALKRMDAGTYGICERCGKPIEKARIKALPYVDLCIKDAQAQSRR